MGLKKLNLSPRQIDALRDLARGLRHGRSGTNGTMNALQRRGLVDLEYVDRRPHWTLTDLGKSALAINGVVAK